MGKRGGDEEHFFNERLSSRSFQGVNMPAFLKKKRMMRKQNKKCAKKLKNRNNFTERSIKQFGHLLTFDSRFDFHFTKG